MAALQIKKSNYGSGMDMLRITGFGDGELSELKSMSHEEAEEKLIEILDSRNEGIGSCYARGYGVYGIWFDNDSAYMNVGRNCD